MIFCFIIVILIFIIFLSAYFSISNNKKKIEGYADLSSPSGMMLQVTDKPTEADKLIVLNELYNNVINHETALNIYDPDYVIKPIGIQNTNIFNNCINIIPILQKQDDEILKLTKNGYIQSKTLSDLLDIQNCINDPSGVTLNKIRGCGGPIVEDNIDTNIEKIFDTHRDMLRALLLYRKERGGGRYHIENQAAWDGWIQRWGKIKTAVPSKYFSNFKEIFDKYKRIDFQDIINMMKTKMDKYEDKSKLMNQDEVRVKYDIIKSEYQIYYNDRDENRNVDNVRDYTYWLSAPDPPNSKISKFTKPFPKKFIREFQEIYDIGGTINRFVVDKVQKDKIKYAAINVKDKNNSIISLANDLYKMVNNPLFTATTQINKLKSIQDSNGVISNGVRISYYKNGKGNAGSKINDEIHALQTKAALSDSENNPPITETQALSKIEAAILYYIMKVVEYQDLEIQNISKNKLNEFKQIYSIHT